MNYTEIFRNCVDKDELLSVYNGLLEKCDDLSEIRNIDVAYTKEFERRRGIL